MHDQDEEWYWVLEGPTASRFAIRRWWAEPGSFLFIPRGTVHGWTLESASGRVLIGFTPAGGERIFREIAAAKAAGGDTPEDWARLGRKTHTRWLS